MEITKIFRTGLNHNGRRVWGFNLTEEEIGRFSAASKIVENIKKENPQNFNKNLAWRLAVKQITGITISTGLSPRK